MTRTLKVEMEIYGNEDNWNIPIESPPTNIPIRPNMSINPSKKILIMQFTSSVSRTWFSEWCRFSRGTMYSTTWLAQLLSFLFHNKNQLYICCQLPKFLYVRNFSGATKQFFWGQSINSMQSFAPTLLGLSVSGQWNRLLRLVEMHVNRLKHLS